MFDLLIAAAGEQFLNLTVKHVSATLRMYMSVITFKHLKIKNLHVIARTYV